MEPRLHSRFGSRGATPLRLPSMHNCHNPKHQVQQNREPSLRLMTDSLDIVAIGIEKECAVGVGVVVRAKPRRPIVRSSAARPARCHASTSTRNAAANAIWTGPAGHPPSSIQKNGLAPAPKPACAPAPVCSAVASFKSTNESGKSVCS